MDILQVILIIVLVLLAINLIVVGVYLTLTLQEFRGTMRKANKVLDTAGTISTPINTLAGFFSGISQSVKAVNEIGNVVDFQKKKEEQ